MKYITKSFLCSIIGVGVLAFLAVHCATAPNLFYDTPLKAYHSCINQEEANSQLLNTSDIRVDENGEKYNSCIDRDQTTLGNAGCPLLIYIDEEVERIEKYCRELYLDIRQ